MARKATDMLDIFRFEPEDGGDGRKRPKKGAGKRKQTAKPRATKRNATAGSRGGAFPMQRRHMMLGGSVVGLLLVLAFTLGLAAGKGGGTTTPTLSAETQIFVLGKVPELDWQTQSRTNPERIRRLLRKEFAVDASLIRLQTKNGEHWIYLGPFRTKDDARRYLERKGLDQGEIGTGYPFRNPQYRQIRP